MPAMAQAPGAERTDRSSLTIVLPAYNEAARIGPALDELFGALCPSSRWLHGRRDGGRGGDPADPGRQHAALFVGAALVSIRVAWLPLALAGGVVIVGCALAALRPGVDRP
jgi:hypothetical protein